MAPRPPKRHPAQREDIESFLDEKAVRWTFVPDVEITEFDLDKSLRNQARINQVLNETTVETYTEAMKRGDKFPAVIAYKVNGKYVAIDGNHRLQAGKNSGVKTSVYELAKDTKPQTIVQMTYEANAKHGLPNSVEDRQTHAVYLIRAGAASQETVAANLNLSKAQVTRAWAKAKADDRAHETGLLPRQWDQFSVQAKTRLGALRTDEGFAAMADLAWRARLTIEEIDRHVVEINKSRSANEQKQIVDRLKDIYRDRIQETGGGTLRSGGPKGMKSPRGALLMGLSHIKSVENRIQGVVDMTVDADLQHIMDVCVEGIMILQDIEDALKKKQKGTK